MSAAPAEDDPATRDTGAAPSLGSIDGLASEHAPLTAPLRASPPEAGRFQLGSDIGAGGGGRVSLVHDRRLMRDVAWKRGDWRLLREARVLAQLEHAGIVPVHDMGFDPDGEAYFAMRVVRGRSLAQVLRTTAEPERASLLRPLLGAAEAVAYAHHRGVVHRDLKPANIMIGRFGESQVVDWGLARALDDAAEPLPAEVRRALASEAIGPVGTPGYMSPEQAAGRPADRRSDVYSLGRVLERVVRREGPGASDPATIAPELMAIVSKATAAEPARRYPDAAAFAADLASYLDGRRVSAHVYGQRELIGRFVRSHRATLVIVAIALVALVVLGALHIARLGEERAAAERAASETRVALHRSDEHLARSLVGEARRQAGQGARAEAEVLAAHALALAEDPDARGILASLAGGQAFELVDRATSPCNEPQLDPAHALMLCASAEGVTLWSHADGAPRALWTHAAELRLARLVDGGVITASSADAGITLLDLDGRVVNDESAPNAPTRKVSWAGRRAVFESAGISAVADLGDASVRPVAPCNRALHAALAVSPDPTRDGAELLAALCKDGTLRRPGGDVQTPLVAPEREGMRMSVLADGRLVIGTTKGEVVLLDHRGAVLRASPIVHGMVRLLEPSPDDRLLAVAGEGDPIEIVSLPDLGRLGSLPRRAKTMAWDRDRPGELVSAGAWLERWRLPPAVASRPLRGAYLVPLTDGVTALDAEPDDRERLAVAFGPAVGVLTGEGMTTRDVGFVTAKGAALDGDRLLAGGISSVIELAADALTTTRVELPKPVRRMVVLADGTRLLGTYASVLRAVDGAHVLAVDAPPLDIAASADRRFAVILREPDRALLRVRAGDPGVEEVGLDLRAEAAAIGRDGERLLTARRGEVAVWTTLGALEQVLDAGDATLIEVEVSGDGRWVAAGARDGVVLLWELGRAAPRARFVDHDERVPALAFSPSARWLVTGSWDRTMRVRDLAAIDAPVAPLIGRLTRAYGLGLTEALGSGPTPSYVDRHILR